MRSQDSDPSIGSISRAAARSLVWACCSLGAAKLLTLAMMMALARLLMPADFGLMAFALVFMMYLEMVGDLGTSAALVVLGTRAPAEWRRGADRLLFVPERPYFSQVI